MEAELWAARMASKRSHLLQASQFLLDRHLNTDDLEAEEDLRTDFACPYCYEEFDIASLCSHLEEIHCFDGRLTMCPVCAVKVGSDVVGHITAQHAHLFKIQRRRRFRRPRELTSAHLQALLGARPTSSSDSFLSSLVAGFPSSEIEENSKPVIENLEKSMSIDEKQQVSFEPTLTVEEREERAKQATSRAQFVQHLMLSTLWPES